MMVYEQRQGAMSNFAGTPIGYVEAHNQMINTGAMRAGVPVWMLWLIGGYVAYRLLK